MNRKIVLAHPLKLLTPLTVAVLILTGGGAYAQLGAPNTGAIPTLPGVPGSMSSVGNGLSPSMTPRSAAPSPGIPTEPSGIGNPRITNYGAGGLQRVPGSPPRFH